MGTEHFNVGTDLRVYFVAESSLLTAAKATATDALQAISATIGRPVGYAWQKDRRNTRSRMGRTQLRQPPIPWSIKTYLRPSGVVATAPDVGIILKHLCGTETVTPATSVAYTLLKDMTALSASIYVSRSHTMEGCYGAIVQRGKISWGGDFVECEFSGVATGYIHAGYTTTNGTGSTATALIVTDASFFTPYSVIQIDSDTNTGAGYQVTAVNYTTNTLTITPAATWETAKVVQHFVPTPTVAGSPLGSTVGSLSLDNGSTTIKHLGGSLEIQNGVDLITDEFGNTVASDVVNAKQRVVDLSADFLLKRQNSYLVVDMRRQVQYDGKVVLGGTAGAICTIDAGVLEFDPSDGDSPEEGVEKWSAKGVALGSSGEDEVSITFT